MELKEHFAGRIFSLISETADELGLECYVVGGYVRDIFLNRPSKDIDVVVVGSGIEMAQAFGKKLGRGAHVSVFKNFGTAQVKFKDTEVEFVGARKESYSHDSRKPIVEDGTLEDDQNRRDFTINAMAVCLNKARFGELVDPFGGLDDLKERTIRTPLDPDITFSDDPLRMMRCIRFATQLNFYIDDETFEALERNKERIKIISRERIADELNKILLSPVPSKGFIDLDRCGLLELIFPELVALQGVEVRNGTLQIRMHSNSKYESGKDTDGNEISGEEIRLMNHGDLTLKGGKFGSLLEGNGSMGFNNLYYSGGTYMLGVDYDGGNDMLKFYGGVYKGEGWIDGVSKFYIEVSGTKDNLVDNWAHIFEWDNTANETDFEASDFYSEDFNEYSAIFKIEDDGLWMMYTEVPEPAAFAAIFGALALALAAAKRRK